LSFYTDLDRQKLVAELHGRSTVKFLATKKPFLIAQYSNQNSLGSWGLATVPVWNI